MLKNISDASTANPSPLEEVKHRIMRQTMEAFLFEGILEVEGKGNFWNIYGRTKTGHVVSYTFEAEQKWSFNRVKVIPYSIKRETSLCTDLFLFLEEIVQHNIKGVQVHSFIQEVLETFSKDYEAKQQQREPFSFHEITYEELESELIEGHPYHPSYKSRMGFSLVDNATYGPEFNVELSMYWLAVDASQLTIAQSTEGEMENVIDEHLSFEEKERFYNVLREKEKANESMVWLPVHPWQWEHHLQNVLIELLAEGKVIFLGCSTPKYRAQQPIRTLAHRNNAQAPYIKLPLSITNTSSSRILASHTIQNAPKISNWLHAIVENDDFLRGQSFALLREIAGVSYHDDGTSKLESDRLYGTLGVIYRENISNYVSEAETAIPLNAVTHIQKNKVPFIQPVIDEYGAEAWCEALITTIIPPLIHLMQVHGIAIEAHAQNIILVLEKGWPQRIIVKDLHDGVRFVPSELLEPERMPFLRSESEAHRAVNRYSFIKAETNAEVRDYLYDALFFICMAELAFFFERYSISEKQFWQVCERVIRHYQREFPEYQERFEQFDLFAGDIRIEEMTKRRLYGDGELHFRVASNPLREIRGSR
ncbi:IucA/IucC family siderophore biosynthesis protein [Salicibibacter halophilus]|uniref:IucA/IucC family siderophore biosynthesis protein n=1 Tax=Salicibibacter halophilus TaxID=2502791 RepID=A0A514LKZ1_9BACI|nr:IucA/IucC family protein [Salicibibacter halophilus]QDI92528.1 IucA/IucC family siderophore biosynthesis protein [Salicibibacter halophilus]